MKKSKNQLESETNHKNTKDLQKEKEVHKDNLPQDNISPQQISSGYFHQNDIQNGINHTQECESSENHNGDFSHNSSKEDANTNLQDSGQMLEYKDEKRELDDEYHKTNVLDNSKSKQIEHSTNSSICIPKLQESTFQHNATQTEPNQDKNESNLSLDLSNSVVEVEIFVNESSASSVEQDNCASPLRNSSPKEDVGNSTVSIPHTKEIETQSRSFI